MRFKQYITETMNFSTDNWKNLSSLLNKDCMSYIKELNGVDTLLLKGVKKIPSYYEVKTIRTNRKPRIISNELHNKMNQYGEKLFGWNIRSEGLFCTNNKLLTDTWGKPSIVFPIGSIKYIWNEDVNRLYELYDDYDNYGNNDEVQKKMIDEIYLNMEDYHDNNLNEYLKRTKYINECIVKCKKYYLINYEWFPTLLKYYSSGLYKKDIK